LSFSASCRSRSSTKVGFATAAADRHRAAVLEPAEQDLVGQRVAHLGLDDARERPRAVDRVVALLGQPRARLGLERDRHAPLGELRLELQDELLDDRLHHLRRQRVERDDGVEAVAELGAEDRSMRLLRALLRRFRRLSPRVVRRRSQKPIVRCAQLARAGVGRHDEHDLPEVGLAAVVVGQRGVVHHLEQDVEDVGVRLLDLVEQQHRVRVLADGVDEQAALLEADVAGRRADQPRDGVLLHVLATCRSG
jgi:hypothetical protein